MSVDLRLGDCLTVMAEMPENSVDTIITDPPYGLTFMGKDWDKGVPGAAFWQEALRVAKPGAIMLAMGGTRTFHRLVVAIEDTGWEVRDTMAYLYGSGFPKSHDISKAIDRQAGAEREVAGINPNYCEARKDSIGTDNGIYGGAGPDKGKFITAPSTPAAQLWDGWGTALKPAMELICVAMKPIELTFADNALRWGVAGLNIDGGRVGTDEVGARARSNSESGNTNMLGVNAQTNFQGAPTQGRFPANVIHDGSDEVLELMPMTNSTRIGNCNERKPGTSGMFSAGEGQPDYRDSGSAARFFYTAKASRSERNAGLEGMEAKRSNYRPNETEDGYGGNGLSARLHDSVKAQNFHPTVKPLALMRYLVRLTKTPTGGVVLDPFMGSGTTGIACVLEGRDFIGIELNAEYLEIAEKRIAHAQGAIPVELPLFTEVDTCQP